MKSLASITLTTCLLVALPAFACTPEEATAKREELAKAITQMTDKSPQKAKEMNDELQQMDLKTSSSELPDKCQLINQRLKELNKAQAQADD